MTKIRMVDISIVLALLIGYMLLNHTLQVFAYPIGSTDLFLLSPDGAWSPLRQAQVETFFGAPGHRLMREADQFDKQAVKTGLPEIDTPAEIGSMITIERKVKDAQFTIRATAVTKNVLVKDDKFQVPPHEAIMWEVELSVYNMRASTGWRYWHAALEFGPELSVEAVDSPGVINPVPRGGSPTEPTLTIKRDESTRKTKVTWSWHSLDNDTSSDFPKRAKAGLRLGVYSSPESGYESGSFIFCDNAEITYMTGAKRPKETTYELSPIVVNVTSL